MAALAVVAGLGAAPAGAADAPAVVSVVVAPVVTEGGELPVEVSRTGDTSGAVGVRLRTVPGTADGADVPPYDRVVTLPAGVASAAVAVPVNADTSAEQNEFFAVTAEVVDPATARLVLGASTGIVLRDGTQAPGAPRFARAQPQDRPYTAVVTWYPPERAGVSPFRVYFVSRYRGDAAIPEATASFAATARTARFENLEPGTYRFDVVAMNHHDSGPGSPRTAPVRVAGPPGIAGPPSRVAATPGDGRVTLRGGGPADRGAEPITAYRVRRWNSLGVLAHTVTVPESVGVHVPLLPDGSTWTFDVTAVSASGPGEPSNRTAPVTVG